LVQAHPEAQKPSDFSGGFFVFHKKQVSTPYKMSGYKYLSFLSALPNASYTNCIKPQILSSGEKDVYLYRYKRPLYGIYTAFMQKNISITF
jgi:hypothetical protein